MDVFKCVAAAVLVAAPLVVASAPAEAMRATQYAAQGRGVYTNSKGVPEGYSYRRGWRHQRYWHRRRYY